MYAHGNVDKPTVLSFIDTFKRLSSSSGLSLSLSHVPDQVITRIPEAKAYIMPITPSNPNENNNCVQAYYQVNIIIINTIIITNTIIIILLIPLPLPLLLLLLSSLSV